MGTREFLSSLYKYFRASSLSQKISAIVTNPLTIPAIFSGHVLVKTMRVNRGILPSDCELADEATVSAVNEQAKEMGIKKSVQVLISKSSDGYSAGFSSPLTRPYIALSKQHSTNKFTIGYALAHCKNKDILNDYLIALSFMPLIMMAGKRNRGFLVVSLSLLYFTSDFAYRRFAEKRADRDALPYSDYLSVAQLVNALDCDKRERILAYKSSYRGKFFYCKNGDSRFLFDVHPSHSSRIKYLNDHLQGRGDAPPIRLFLQENADAEFKQLPLPKEISDEMRQVVAKSKKAMNYVDLERIELKPYKNGGNVYLYRNDGFRHVKTYPDLQKITHDPRGMVDLITSVVTSPMILSILFTLAKNDAELFKKDPDFKNDCLNRWKRWVLDSYPDVDKDSLCVDLEEENKATGKLEIVMSGKCKSESELIESPLERSHIRKP